MGPRREFFVQRNLSGRIFPDPPLTSPSLSSRGPLFFCPVLLGDFLLSFEPASFAQLLGHLDTSQGHIRPLCCWNCTVPSQAEMIFLLCSGSKGANWSVLPYQPFVLAAGPYRHCFSFCSLVTSDLLMDTSWAESPPGWAVSGAWGKEQQNRIGKCGCTEVVEV